MSLSTRVSKVVSNGTPENYCKVPNEHVIGFVLVGQNGGYTTTHPKTRGGSIRIEGRGKWVDKTCNEVLKFNTLENIRFSKYTVAETASS